MLALLLLLVLPSFINAFSFTTPTNPTSCENLSLTWSGGTSPYSILLSPLFGSPRNVSIPDSAFSKGQGSFTFQLPFPQGQKFILTLSDATGFGSGGSTVLLNTGPSRGGTCNTSDPGVAFSFELNSALQQCRPYVVSGYSGAIQPVTIIGIIPGGNSFVLIPPPGSTSYRWSANVAAGTSIIFSMFDSQGRNGGTSDLKTVGITDDPSCLNNQSPYSTAILSASSPATPSTTPSPSPSSAPGNQTSIAAIAGTVIGALLFLAVLITLGLFFLRKKQGSRFSTSRHSRGLQSEVDLSYNPAHRTYPYPSDAALAASPLHYQPSGAPYDSNPFVDSYMPSPTTMIESPDARYELPSHYHSSSVSQPSLHSQPYPHSGTDPFASYTLGHLPHEGVEHVNPRMSDQRDDSMSMTSTQRKAAMARGSTYTSSRFILHTDVEDELPPPNSEGIVELPPQYSERRPQLQVVPQHDLATLGSVPSAPPHRPAS